MVTYSVSFGVTGTLDPDDYDEDLRHKQTGELIQWPKLVPDNSTVIDDLWPAGVNG